MAHIVHAEPHKRFERITEDSELSSVQCDYLVLKGVACSLRRIESFEDVWEYGTSTFVETEKCNRTRSQ